MRKKQEEEDPMAKISIQKSACVDRIQAAWNLQIGDILHSSYCLTGNIGRDSLRTLAALAESEPLSRVKPILISCIHERGNKEACEGQSRVKRLTRMDVLKTKDIIEQQNQVPQAKFVPRKRALSNSRAKSQSPDSHPAKCARPGHLVASKLRTDTLKSEDAPRTSHSRLDLVSNLSKLQSFANHACRVLRIFTMSVLQPQATVIQNWKRPTAKVAFRVYSI